MYEYYREQFFDYIIGESVEDYLCEAEANIGNDNMIRTMRHFKQCWRPAINKYKRAIKEGELDKARKYRKECESLLKTLSEVLSELDYELSNSDALLGTLESMLKNVARGIIGMKSFNAAYIKASHHVYKKDPEAGMKMAVSRQPIRDLAGAAIIGAGTISDLHAIATSVKTKKATGGKIGIQEFNVERAKLLRQYQKIVKAFNKIAQAHEKLLSKKS